MPPDSIPANLLKLLLKELFLDQDTLLLYHQWRSPHISTTTAQQLTLLSVSRSTEASIPFAPSTHLPLIKKSALQAILKLAGLIFKLT
ncbi:hypothetical protein H6F95_22780 [Cyanobacteria bacterium FACHB-471]|nr:hypothetical protein [Cyanobacteria bacterium FACHB-471]